MISEVKLLYTKTYEVQLRGYGSRIGVDAPWVQDFFQNGIHKYITGSPNFNSNKGTQTNIFLQQYIYNNPFGLY